jgi:hypothetical protein
MYAVHKALMGALDAAPAYVAKADGDSERVEMIGSFYENVVLPPDRAAATVCRHERSSWRDRAVPPIRQGSSTAPRSAAPPLFTGWNKADWEVFARYHTDDVLVDFHGQPPTHGIGDHIDAMKAFIESTGGAPLQVKSHPISFGSGEWTCTVGELETGGQMVTVAKWREGAIAEEYIWL